MIEFSKGKYKFAVINKNNKLTLIYYVVYNNIIEEVQINDNNEFIINLTKHLKLKAMIVDSKMFTWRKIARHLYAVKLNELGLLNVL